MVDEVRINSILEIPSLVVRKNDVDRLARVSSIGSEFGRGFRHHGMVDGVDDSSSAGEETVGFDFLQSLRHGFLTEGTPDLLEGEQF